MNAPSRCLFWSDCGVKGGGCCAKNLYGGRPSLGVCRICPQYRGTPRGLGDVIHLIAAPVRRLMNLVWRTKSNGKTCGCEQRRRKLNQRCSFSFGRK
jgi:hypothetical protein